MARKGERLRWTASDYCAEITRARERLQTLTGARLVGLPARHAEWQDTTFEPHASPEDGQCWRLGEDCTLRAVHTPGHAANHVCWWLEQEALLRPVRRQNRRFARRQPDMFAHDRSFSFRDDGYEDCAPIASGACL